MCTSLSLSLKEQRWKSTELKTLTVTEQSIWEERASKRENQRSSGAPPVVETKANVLVY